MAESGGPVLISLMISDFLASLVKLTALKIGMVI